MMNEYISIELIKGAGVLSITGTAQDARLLQLIENISRGIDKFTKRFFYNLELTRTFDGPIDGNELFVPDLTAITTLNTDANRDGTFERTFAAGDFRLYPLNSDPENDGNPESKPFWKIVASVEQGVQSMPIGRETVQVVGRWGYWRHINRATAVVSGGGIDATSTTLTVDVITGIETGNTILIESEQMAVRSISGVTVTVRRAINGTTGATHAAAVAIDVFEYPGPIMEAVTIMASRLWKRKESAFANVIGTPDGQMTVFRGLDDDVKFMLKPYRTKLLRIIVPEDTHLGRNQLTDIDVLRLNRGGF